MGGELISVLRLLRLKDALRSTINSKEFLDQKKNQGEMLSIE
jgi:hypothetical protein